MNAAAALASIIGKLEKLSGGSRDVDADGELGAGEHETSEAIAICLATLRAVQKRLAGAQ